MTDTTLAQDYHALAQDTTYRDLLNDPYGIYRNAFRCGSISVYERVREAFESGSPEEMAQLMLALESEVKELGVAHSGDPS